MLVVTARSATAGFGHGVATALGVVAGDLVFILLAVFGLALLVELFGPAVTLIRYLGAAYLLWLAWRFWQAPRRAGPQPEGAAASHGSSFLLGLLITLGDQKAVLFYLVFLPAFLDITALSLADLLALVLITVAAVGGVKIAYAYAADRVQGMLGAGAGLALNRGAALVLGFVALWLLLS